MIEGNKVLLKPINKNDTPNIIKWRNSENVRKNFIYQEELTIETHTRWLENKVNTGEVVQFIIIEKVKNLDIGSVFLRDIDTKNNKAEFGIFIGEDEARGKGLGQEATRLIVEYGFNQLKLNKIFLRVFAQNTGAIKSYEKAGFIKEGLFKEDVKINDSYYDVIFMGIINENGGV